MVARSVRWRSGRLRGPPVRTASLWSSRASSMRGESSAARAAANSMASGRPSSLAQMAATSRAFASLSRKAGTRACTRAR